MCTHKGPFPTENYSFGHMTPTKVKEKEEKLVLLFISTVSSNIIKNLAIDYELNLSLAYLMTSWAEKEMNKHEEGRGGIISISTVHFFEGA